MVPEPEAENRMQTITQRRSGRAVLTRIAAVVAVALITLAGLSATATATGLSPVGRWSGVNTRSDGDHPTHHVLRPDGAFFITNEQNTTTKGRWWRTGANTFHIRVRGEKVYDANGQYFAYVDFDQDAIQSGPDSWTSSGPSSFYLADGTLLDAAIVTFTMTRTS
jgi:hypothetical protein